MAMTASQGYAGCRYSSGFGGLGSGFTVQGLESFPRMENQTKKKTENAIQSGVI